MFSLCDGKYYTLYEPAKIPDNSRRIIEMENLRYQASRFRVDGEGYEWAGLGYFFAEHSRLHNDGQWGETTNGAYGIELNEGSITFGKKNGQWQVEKVVGKFTPIPCSEIPKSKSKLQS